MTQLFDPKLDYIFKKIFGSEKHPKILISFLNACIKPIDPIVSVTFKNTEVPQETSEDGYSRLDILAKTDKDEVINVEMQRSDQKNMVKRSLYYWSKAFIGEYKGKQRYADLPRTVCINVLNFNLLKDEEFYHNTYVIRNRKNTTKLDKDETFEMHFVEIPKMKITDKSDLLSLWVKFLDDPNDLNVLEMEREVDELHEAREELTRLSSDPKEAEIYRMRENAANDKANALLSAKDEGRKEGKAEGREEGKAEGREESKIETAKKLLIKGFDLEVISEITELSIENIKKLNK